jgi:alpha-1,2-mannosyltransferase
MNSFGEPVAARLRALGRPWELAVFLWLPTLFFGVVLAADVHFSGSLGDWEIFRTAARAVVDGSSPYSAAHAASLAHNDRFVYPPITALLVAPIAVLPDEAGRVLVLLLTLACVVLALRLLRVEDWRCYGLAVVTAPVLDTVSLGALSSALLLGVATAWRYRDKRYVVAPVTALTAVAKLFAWPLFVWLLVTRRLRTAVDGAVVVLVLLLGGWAAIGFAGLRGYPHMLRLLSRVESVQSYSVVGLLRLHGTAATAVTGVLVLAVFVGVIVAARGADGDRRSLTVAVAGALLATPVLWLHYLVLLFVPIALARPRLSPLWFAPLAFWVTPFAHSDGSIWRTCFVLAVAAAIVLRSLSLVPSGAARRSRLAVPRRVLSAL